MFQRCWNHQPEPAKIMGFLTYGIPKSHRISLVSLLYNVRGTHVQDWKWLQWRCIYVHPQNDEIGIKCIYIYILYYIILYYIILYYIILYYIILYYIILYYIILYYIIYIYIIFIYYCIILYDNNLSRCSRQLEMYSWDLHTLMIDDRQKMAAGIGGRRTVAGRCRWDQKLSSLSTWRNIQFIQIKSWQLWLMIIRPSHWCLWTNYRDPLAIKQSWSDEESLNLQKLAFADGGIVHCNVCVF